MKFLVVLFAIVMVVLADHEHGHEHTHDHGTEHAHDHDHDHSHHEYTVKTHDDLMKYRDECVTKLSVPAETVEKIKEWQYPDDEITHCYMKCIMEHFGLFDEKTGYDVHKVHHQLVGGDHSEVDHHDDIHTKVEKCADKNTQGSDACTWAYRGAMCFLHENLQLVKKSVEH